MNTMTKLTEQQKEVNLIFLFTIWLKSAGYNKINTSTAIRSLQRFMTTELNWDKKRAGQKILWFLREHHQVSANELISIWELIQE
jgi:hypothetical protein